MADHVAFIKKILNQLANHQDLNRDEAEQLFSAMMGGDIEPIAIAAILMGLAVKGETIDELASIVKIMRANAHKISAPSHAIDIVGTGGDGKGTHNISTMTSLVVAACDVPVAKHGNRNLSSQSGAADVLNALGVNLECDFALLEKSLHEANICFLMAPRHHPNMRHVMPVRQTLGIRTLFNIVGPMSNPANVKNYLLGVYDKKWLRPICEALMDLGAENIMVVHSHDGMDELSTTGKNYYCAYDGKNITEGEIHPSDAGLKTAHIDDLIGGTPQENAQMVKRIMAGEQHPVRDIVLLNAAAALMVAQKCDDFATGRAMAEKAIDNGLAEQTLNQLIAITNK